jgi:NADPH:quinone reductase-like Zn-dependent oxidoreductase
MRAIRAETFSGYQGLKLTDLPKPAVTKGKVMVRITAAGVTPLDHTILSGTFRGLKATLRTRIQNKNGKTAALRLPVNLRSERIEQ